MVSGVEQLGLYRTQDDGDRPLAQSVACSRGGVGGGLEGDHCELELRKGHIVPPPPGPGAPHANHSALQHGDRCGHLELERIFSS